MCGINGFITPSKKHNAEALIKNMNQAIIHRGPDDQGFFVQQESDATLAQGQVRLAIIDLSDAGFQPMFYDRYGGAFSAKHNTAILDDIGEKSIRIVFNGEIYNYQEIREELITKGYNFSSNSDTEVILASYLEYGTDCVNHFNGMRSFALYDPSKKELFCSRDRFGKKPFYYYFDGKQFIFSSELKGILEHKELAINTKENISSEALDFYFTTGFIPAPWTIYKNIKKLEARHSLTIKITDTLLYLNDSCYYEIPEYAPIYDKKALLSEGKSLFEDAVKIRMFTSDVPVGAFLSGGLDSSSVVAEMTKWVDKKKLNTFSIGFEGKYDESHYIHIVEKAFGTNHHHAYFKESDFERMIDDISFYYDEPFADYSNFPTRFVSELARKNVTVSLSGDGGDEIFGGYMMHQIGAQMSIIRKVPLYLRKLLYLLVPKTANNLSLLSKLKEALRVSLLPVEEFYANIGESTIYKPDVYKQWVTQHFKEVLDKAHGNFTQAMIDFDLFYNTLADNFLVKTDRASMAQPLEIRSPFLDWRWIDYSRRLPTKWKVNWRKTKILMREIIKDIVPKEIITRGKQGFKPPIDTWILQDKYMKKIEEGIAALYKGGIINGRRYAFFVDYVIKKENIVFDDKKICLFLFITWYKRWIK